MSEVKNKKKKSSIIQVSIGVLAVILAILIIIMMGIVSDIQGTARIVNYTGLVRGETQRLIKLQTPVSASGSSSLSNSSHLFLFGSPVASSRYTFRCSKQFIAAYCISLMNSYPINSINTTISAVIYFSMMLIFRIKCRNWMINSLTCIRKFIL